MQKKYFLNLNSNKMHIEGYCRESKIKPYHIKYFETQDDVMAYGGTAVSICKNCQKRRELLMQED